MTETFGQEWSVWEGIKISQQEYNRPKQDYNTYLLKVVNFNQVHQFIDIMNHLPHSCPSRLFTDQNSQQLRKFKLASKDGEYRQIESVCLFKDGIHPSWEDQYNIKGSSIQYDFKYIDNDIIDNIWRKMLVDVVSQEIVGFKNLNGIRILEKFSPSRKIKVEFWYSVNISDDEECYQQLLKDNLNYFKPIYNSEKIETKLNVHETSKSKVDKIEKKDNLRRENHQQQQQQQQ